jgi:hypothetical protein
VRGDAWRFRWRELKRSANLGPLGLQQAAVQGLGGCDGDWDGLMMQLKDLLRNKKTAIVERWMDYTLSSYAGDASDFLKREKNPFANPVGHALRLGTLGIFENLLEGMDAPTVCSCLKEIIKIRAIQDFSPAQAVSFVFLLKQAIRSELGGVDLDSRLSPQLEAFEKEIDQVALFAFDIYVQCREQVHELRINEVKRSVAALTKRLNSGHPDPVPFSGMPDRGSTPSGGSK